MGPPGQRFTGRSDEIIDTPPVAHNSYLQVATELGISPHTVKTHLERIFEKLGANDRAQAVAIAIRTGIVKDQTLYVQAAAGALPCRPCHQRHCVPGDFRCLAAIAPERVAAAAERALASRRPAAGTAPLRGDWRALHA